MSEDRWDALAGVVLVVDAISEDALAAPPSGITEIDTGEVLASKRTSRSLSLAAATQVGGGLFLDRIADPSKIRR